MMTSSALSVLPFVCALLLISFVKNILFLAYLYGSLIANDVLAEYIVSVLCDA